MSNIVGAIYELIENFGEKNIFLARNLALGIEVVIKADKCTDSNHLEKLKNEAEKLKNFKQSNIPQGYDFFIEDNVAYTVIPKFIGSTYELIKSIGSGGGGNVFLAEHLHLKIKVVVKADKRKVSGNLEKLRREVDILKELHHSNIPQVYDFFVEYVIAYTVMGFVEGESLDKPLKRGEKFSQPQVINWAKQILKALAYLHNPKNENLSKGFIHRDIKPANLMRTPNNTIFLIDFNIAFALGEECDFGLSLGYASPEHYGYDFSFISDTEIINKDETITLAENTRTNTNTPKETEMPKKKIIPDVRSDIYSLGATLYHLLSGKRPAKYVMDVIPLSEKEFSPQIVKIISKAMHPNPNLRYQTAEEMLNAFRYLHPNDPRTEKLEKNKKIARRIIAICFVFGIASTFVGLKRIQVTESWLKLSEYSQNALKKGDSVLALDYAMQAVPKNTNLLIPTCISQAQHSLTEALRVYDLADGFKYYKVVELPSNPLYMAIAPNGKTAVCIYSGAMAVFDTESTELLVTLPTDKSALAEAEYLTDTIIIYSGTDGLKAYDISKQKEIWSGNPATGISISQDKKYIAAVYKEETFATVYDANTGTIISKIDFNGKNQSVTVNDSFANPNDNIFQLNKDGSFLAVSFADGSLEIYDLHNTDGTIEIFDKTSGYTHFEGGFYEQYFAFSATKAHNSIFAVIDTENKTQTGGFDIDGYFGVKTDSNGVYVQMENILVKIHPVTGEQTPLVTTSETILNFSVNPTYTAVVSQGKLMFFDSNANLIESFEQEITSDFVQIAEGTVLIGNMNMPTINIMKYESHADKEVFTYDADYEHDEARVSADGKTVMLFSYKQFRIYDKNGTLINEVSIPNASQVYDQQFRRKESESYLEVTYNDGTQINYDARDGSVISEKQIEQPDLSLYEEFYTDKFKIESPLHGAPIVYDRKTNKFVCEWNEEGYLTYVTQVGDFLIAQYVTVNDEYYGVLLNHKCETLAYLPYLSDVMEEELYFDYPMGTVRKSYIFNIDKLMIMAEEKLKGEN